MLVVQTTRVQQPGQEVLKSMDTTLKVASSPGPISVFQCCTLKNSCNVGKDRGAWGRGYFEGIVERVEHVLELHKQETITTFGIRRTEKPRSSPTVGKETTVNQDTCTQDSADKPKV